MNRELRREIARSKYISRVKARLHYIRIKDGTCVNKFGTTIPNWRQPLSWKEADEKCKWIKLLKHGKVYSRSNESRIEKHRYVKSIREESKRLIQELLAA
jgi:hypothetical protein